MKKKGTSNVPLIMGIIGGVLGIPGAFCAGACSAGVSSLAKTSSQTAGEVGAFYMLAAILGAILGLVGGILGKKMPGIAGVMMIVAAGMSGFTMIIGNMIGLGVAILFMVGGVFCFVQKKEIID